MKISVITVAYKNSKVVIDLLNSIAKYNDIGNELEVIVVDNSPEYARIEEAIKIAEYEDYIYIKADNKGFGAGNNRGAEIARGDILAFLNPDIILIEPIFKKICEKFAEDEKLAWLGGQLLLADGKKNLSYGYRFEYRGLFWGAIVNFLNHFFPLFFVGKMYLTGADIVIRKDIFEQIGCFDENIFMYHEEADLMQRILRLNDDYKFKFFPDIRMIHLEGQSTPFRAEAYKKDMVSAVYYAKKYGIDYKKIYYREYKSHKWKLLIDKIFRPQIAKQREYAIKVLEEQFPEFIN